LARTLHSVAIDGEPGMKPSDSAANLRGGSQAVIFATESMPGMKVLVIEPPTLASIVVGTNHAETPGPVAMAAHTCSGVPGTATSTCTLCRPFGSRLTLSGSS